MKDLGLSRPGTMQSKVVWFSLEGWQTVAGGRNAVETTGLGMKMISDPDGVSEVLAPLSGCGRCPLLSGGFRYAPTTGYSLAALQAGNPPATEAV